MALLSAGAGRHYFACLTALNLQPSLTTLPLAEHMTKRVVGMITPSTRSEDPLVRSFKESLLETITSIKKKPTIERLNDCQQLM